MTREEAIKEFESELRCAELNTYPYVSKQKSKALKMAIEALKQEPILDKIRAEIADLEEGISSYHNDRPWVFKDEILQIIDKYRQEG